jgi:hypothetical protein
MKLSIFLSPENLQLSLSYIKPQILTASKEWLPSSSQEQREIISILITQLILQCSIYALVRITNKFDIKHYDLIRTLIVNIIKKNLSFVRHPGLMLAITTSRQVKRHKNVDLGEMTVIRDIVSIFDEAGNKKSDKLVMVIFEQVKLAIVDATKFVKKHNKFVDSVQLSLIDQDSNSAFF